MEATILLGILGAGYLLNKNNNQDDNNNIDLPKQNDAYTTDYFHESKQNQEHSSSLRDNYENVRIPGVKNITYQNIEEYLNSDDNMNNSEGKEYIYSSSAGSKIDKNNFLVNDQGIKIEPFFTKAPPNLNLNDNKHLSRHQGGSDYRIQKREQTPFFENYKQELDRLIQAVDLPLEAIH